jgi:hypothetical protein
MNSNYTRPSHSLFVLTKADFDERLSWDRNVEYVKVEWKIGLRRDGLIDFYCSQ